MTLRLLLVVLLFNLILQVQSHGRLMEPVSRASAWRKGFKNPADYNDNEGYCGGYSHQWLRARGKCGICGDPWGQKPRRHEAPGGYYANGIIVKEYRVGAIMDVEIDLSANHRGSFTFKLCQNNNVKRDSHQRCFDRHVLKVYPEMTETYELPSEASQTFYIQLKLPDGLTCKQCVLQWTYNTANSWGNCPNGTNQIGCGPQETFRACSDIRISRSGRTLPKIVTKRPDLIGNRAPDKGVFYYNSFTGGNTIDNEVLPSPPTPVPSPFKFTWFNRDIDLVPPAAPDATTAVGRAKPRRRKRPKRPRKKISDRPRRKKNKNRRRKNRRKNKNRRRKNRRKSTTTLVPRIFASADREFVTSPSFLTTTTTVFTPPSPPPVPEPEEVHGSDSDLESTEPETPRKRKPKRRRKKPKRPRRPRKKKVSDDLIIEGTPEPTPNPEGFVSISFGDEEDINFNLGPGQADHAVDKLKQLEEALNCEGLACLDVKY